MDLKEIPPDAFERHPWEVARARFFVDVLAGAGLLARRLDLLDVGAGDGFFAGEVARRLPGGSGVVCYEPSYRDEHLARFARSFGGLTFSFARTLPDQTFDLIVLMDVLEHVRDDGAFLADLVAHRLRPGGYALISVPAWPSLFSRYDVSVVHHRRYEPRGLADVLRSSGLTIEGSGGLFHSLLVVRSLEKLVERARGIDSVPSPAHPPATPPTGMASWRRRRIVGASIDWALRADNALSAASARWHLPLPGLSAWALARRR